MKNLLEKYKDKLPESYLEFMSENKRFYGDLGEEFGYVDIWEIGFLTSVFDTICNAFDSMGRDWFPIGSDGGDEIICIKLVSPDKELFCIPGISISDEDAAFYCDNFSKLYNAIKQHSFG
jgi:hypothetical protein